MKASMHNGRKALSKHNDRSFMIGLSAEYLDERAGHIDRERTKDNVYISRDPTQDFMSNELAYYREHYQAALDARNERYRKSGHPEDCRTIEQVYKAKRTRPEEVILQIGNMTESVSPQTLQQCFKISGGNSRLFNCRDESRFCPSSVIL